MLGSSDYRLITYLSLSCLFIFIFLVSFLSPFSMIILLSSCKESLLSLLKRLTFLNNLYVVLISILLVRF